MDVQVYTHVQIGITTKRWGLFHGAEEFAQELEPFHETAGRKGRGFLPAPSRHGKRGHEVQIVTCQSTWKTKTLSGFQNL